MNPQFNYSTLTVPHVSAPIIVQDPTLVGKAKFLNDSGNYQTLGNQTVGDIVGNIAQQLNPLAQIQQTFEDNLPNYLFGAIGLFMVFVGISSLAAPAIKEVI